MSLENRRRAMQQIDTQSNNDELQSAQELEQRAEPIRRRIAEAIYQHPIYIEVTNFLENPELLQFLAELWTFWDPKQQLPREKEIVDEGVETSLFGLRKKKTINKSKQKYFEESSLPFTPEIVYPLSPEGFANGISIQRLQQDFGENLDTENDEAIEKIVEFFINENKIMTGLATNRRSGGLRYPYEVIDHKEEKELRQQLIDVPYGGSSTAKIVLDASEARWGGGDAVCYRYLVIQCLYSTDGISFELSGKPEYSTKDFSYKLPIEVDSIEELMNVIADETNKNNFLVTQKLYPDYT